MDIACNESVLSVEEYMTMFNPLYLIHTFN